MRAPLKEIDSVKGPSRFGRGARIEGRSVEVTDAPGAVSLGGQVRLTTRNNKKISCEVVGFRDDHNKPISDAVRSILDGHIVLEHSIAERGRFPAIDILKSVSRAMPGCDSEAQQSLVLRARATLSVHDDMSEFIRLGVHEIGTNPEVDNAVKLHAPLEGFLARKKDERVSSSEDYEALSNIVGDAGYKG